MSKIELSNIVIDGLRSLNTVISTDLTKKIISNAVKVALHSDASKPLFISHIVETFSTFDSNLLQSPDIPSNPEVYASKPDYTKQIEYSVLTLLFLATKYDFDNAKLRELLNHHGISDLATEELITVYEKNQTSLTIKNLTTGLSLPHVTNVEWKLTCDVKSSQLDASTGSVNFRINLGRYKELTGDRETIAEFVCNAEELQFLIGRLKEIERHCDRVSVGK